MAISDELKASLEAPLNPGRVAVLRHNNAPYLEGWDVIACANAIFGFDGWSHEVLDIESMGPRLYRARVRVEALGVSRTDIGTGTASGDTPEAHDTAIKGAATDGLKRALRTFGAQFGNDLYDKSGPPAAQSAPAARTPAPQTNATPAKTGIQNDGDFFAWAWKEHRINKTTAIADEGVVIALNAHNYEAAQAAVVAMKVPA